MGQILLQNEYLLLLQNGSFFIFYYYKMDTSYKMGCLLQNGP